MNPQEIIDKLSFAKSQETLFRPRNIKLVSEKRVCFNGDDIVVVKAFSCDENKLTKVEFEEYDDFILIAQVSNARSERPSLRETEAETLFRTLSKSEDAKRTAMIFEPINESQSWIYMFDERKGTLKINKIKNSIYEELIGASVETILAQRQD